MVDRFGEHRFDEAHIVDDLTVIRQQLTEPRTGLAVLSKSKSRPG